MPADDKRQHPDLRSELADWHDEEASLQIDTIAAACALIAYADGVVRQADELHLGEPEAHVDFHLDRAGVDPPGSGGKGSGQHQPTKTEAAPAALRAAPLCDGFHSREGTWTARLVYSQRAKISSVGRTPRRGH